MGRGAGDRALTAKGLLYGSAPRRRGPATRAAEATDPWPRFYNALLDRLAHDQYIPAAKHQCLRIEDKDAGKTVSHLVFELNQTDGTAIRIMPTNEDGRLGVALCQAKQNEDTILPKHILNDEPSQPMSVYHFEQFVVDNAQEIGADYVEIIKVDLDHVDNYLNSDQDYQFVGAHWEEKHNLDNAKRGAHNMIEIYRLD